VPAPRWSTVLLIVCLAPVAAACSSPPPPAPSLAGTTWQLVEIQSMDDSQGLTKVPDPGKYTVTFGDDGRAAFRIDCNRGNGSWETEASEDGQSGSLTFGPIATTMMACPPPTIDQKVSTALPMVRGYLLKDNRLHMSQFADGDTLTWEPV
jgi:heat shock protein HslJ